MQKQILYPQLLPRIFSVMIDTLIILTILIPIYPYIKQFNLWLFVKYFPSGLPFSNLPQGLILDPNSATSWQNNSLSLIMVVKLFLYFLNANLFTYIVSGIYYVVSWARFGTTFGKYLARMRVVDLTNHQKLTLWSSFLRFLGYFIAPISFWAMLFNKQRIGLHDKLAHSVVIVR